MGSFEEPRPNTPQMKDLTDRLKHYGASDEFCKRIYATGTAAPPEYQPKSTSGTAQGVQVPRLMIPRVANLANNLSPRTRGYATARPRMQTHAKKPNPQPRVRPELEEKTDTFMTEVGGERPMWEDPDVVGHEDVAREERDNSREALSPLTLAAEIAAAEAEARGSFDAGPHVPSGAQTDRGGVYGRTADEVIMESWYEANRPRHQMVRGTVEADIQNMLLQSREVAGRLRPKPVARKSTLEFLSTPRMPMGALENYDGTDPVEWTWWKMEEMSRAREAKEAKRAYLESWQQRNREEFKRWKHEKETFKKELEAQAKALDQEQKRYARELHRWMKAKSKEEVEEYSVKRSKDITKSRKLREERTGDFEPYFNHNSFMPNAGAITTKIDTRMVYP